MIEITQKDRCSGCWACVNKCPVNAIEMIEDEKGFKYPKIDKEKCVNCGLCEKACPIVNNEELSHEVEAFACMNKDENIRLNSSSGGVFNLLAEEVIKRDGVVYGAAFDDNFEVKHIKVDNNKDLERLRTSKYVQSEVGMMYSDAKKMLEEGKYVLFTGTPCQIEGLYSFLGKEYDKLYTQDIICHGVPSPLVWREYLKFRKMKDSKNPVRINFRYKDEGWSLYALLLQYNNSAYKTSHRDDLFMQSFLKNVILRDSCYACSFKKKIRKSDITLADFWGINKVLPEMNDNKGTSLVIINSDRGKELFNIITEKIEFKEVNLEEALKYNASMIRSVAKPNNADDFFKEIGETRFDILVKKYVPHESKLVKILKKIKRKLEKKKVNEKY